MEAILIGATMYLLMDRYEENLFHQLLFLFESMISCGYVKRTEILIQADLF